MSSTGHKLEFCNSEILSSEKAELGKYDVQTRTNENKTLYMLVIRNISEVDAGEYYCSLTPEGQTVIYAIRRLVFYTSMVSESIVNSIVHSESYYIYRYVLLLGGGK